MIRIATFFALALLGLLFVSAPAMAADTQADIEARIKARFASLEKYRDQGKAGEVFDGTTQAVKDEYLSDAKLKTLITEENADRKALFALLAEKDKDQGSTVEKVATAYARRLFELAKPEHYLKGKNGRWIKKSDAMRR